MHKGPGAGVFHEGLLSIHPGPYAGDSDVEVHSIIMLIAAVNGP